MHAPVQQAYGVSLGVAQMVGTISRPDRGCTCYTAVFSVKIAVAETKYEADINQQIHSSMQSVMHHDLVCNPNLQKNSGKEALL